MAPTKSNRRSSARLSGSEATTRTSDADNLRRSAMSRTHNSVHTSSSAQATPNYTLSNQESMFSSVNNTAAGIAKARAEYNRDLQETPRTTMLELGRRITQVPLNPLDKVKVTKADDNFKPKNKTSRNVQLHKTSAFRKNIELDLSDKQDSSNSLQDTLAIHSMAEDALSASAIASNVLTKDIQLRRVVRASTVGSPQRKISGTLSPEIETETNSSPNLDVLDFQDLDKENKENNFAKRPIALTRRLSRKTNTKKNSETNPKSSLVKASGILNNRENITSSIDDLDISDDLDRENNYPKLPIALPRRLTRRTNSEEDSKNILKSSVAKASSLLNSRENITSSLDDIDISEESPNNIAKHNIPKKGILARRIRNTRSKNTTDFPIDSDALGMKETLSNDEINVSDVDITAHGMPNSKSKILLRRNQRQQSKGSFGVLSSESEAVSLNSSRSIHDSTTLKVLNKSNFSALGIKETSNVVELNISNVDATTHDKQNSKLLLRRNQRPLSKGTFENLSSEVEAESLNNSQTLNNSTISKTQKKRQQQSEADLSQTNRTDISMSLEESNTETNGKSLQNVREIGLLNFRKRQENKNQLAREQYQEELRNLMPTEMSETCAYSNITENNASKGTTLSLTNKSLHNSKKYPMEGGASVHETSKETTKIQEYVNSSGVAVSKRDYQHRKSLNSPKPISLPTNASNTYPSKSNSKQQNTTETSTLELPQQVEMNASPPLISNRMSPKSIYNSPLSNTIRLENDSTQVQKENETLQKIKRKSIYFAGSQEQENHTFDEEHMQTFLPNIESTRLMQNTVNITAASDASEINSEDKRSEVEGPINHSKTVAGKTFTKSSAAAQNNSPLVNNNLDTLPDPSHSNSEHEAASRNRLSNNLEERLKNIGCWDNNEKIALNLIEKHRQRRLDNASRKTEQEKHSTKHPKFTPKPKTRKTYPTLLHPREIAYHFERFSGLKLGKGCLPVLIDAFQRFTQLFIKRLKENNVGKTFCLADVKLVMQQFGFIPKKDYKNMELRYMLSQLLDPEDYALLMPMSSLNGIRGATSLSKDIWEKVPKSSMQKNKK